MKFADSRITLNRLRTAGFPDGSDGAAVLERAADRWNAVTGVGLRIIGSNGSAIIDGNGVSEIAFDKDAFITKPGTPAYVAYTVNSECHITEADIYFNPEIKPNEQDPPIKFNAREDAQHNPYRYGSAEGLKNNGHPMAGTAAHELGHVLGLQHTSADYSIMGSSFSHVSRNGNATYYGPGADGALGGRFLYSLEPNRRFSDLEASIFSWDGSLPTQPEYSRHSVRDWEGAINGPQCSSVFFTDDRGTDDPKDDKKIFVKDGVNCYAADAGTTVGIPFTFEFSGNVEEAVYFTVYLSKDNIIDSRDTPLIIYRYAHRGEGDLLNILERILKVPIPAKLTTGDDWYIGVIIERQPGTLPPGTPDEASDKNNAAWYPFKVLKGNSAPITALYLGGTDLLVINPNHIVSYAPVAYDPDGDPLSYSIANSPSHGTLEVTNGRYKFIYRPDLDFVGKDSFRYRVQDPYGLFTEGEVDVSIVLPTHDLVVNKLGSGSGLVISNPAGIDCGSTCVKEFAENAVVELSAIPDSGMLLVGWDAACSGTGTCKVPMSTFRTVSARFERAPTSFRLTVNKAGTGFGIITSNPAGIQCAEDCIEEYPAGANIQVTLTPAPDAGSAFLGWNGACSGSGPCTVTMYGNRAVTATFATAIPTIFVVATLHDAGVGSLRQAVLDANTNVGDDVIQFQRGLTGTIALTGGQLTITDSVTLEGPGASALAVSGSKASRIFDINPGEIGTVTIDGLTIKEGFDGDGGNGGGGIIINTGSGTISRSAVINNVSASGNGGGGIRNFGANLTLSDSTVSANSATNADEPGEGGGIRNDMGALTLNNSTVSGNSGSSGGGIALDDGTITLTNSTVTSNTALFGGGGIFVGSGDLILGNSAITGNTAPTDTEVQNFGTLTSRGHNLFGEGGASGVSVGTTLATSDLVLAGAVGTAIGPLADNGGQTQTHKPVIDGPVIDAGDNGLIPQGITTDQRGAGFPRISGDTVDIGAVEKHIKPLPLAATLIAPKGLINDKTPTYQWNAVAGAARYYLKVSDSTGAVKIGTWYTGAQAGCGAGTGTCAVTPGTALAKGADKWWIRTRNSGGLGPWSRPLGFKIGARN